MNVRKMKPTKAHRPALWSGILGTVYAMNDDGEVRYFDYDREGAKAFAGVTDDRDPRLARKPRPVSYAKHRDLEPRGLIVWITRA